MIQIDVILVGVDLILIDVIQNYRIFAPNFFNFNIILTPSIFLNAVAFRVFTFTFLRNIPRRAPVGKILYPSIKEDRATGVSWWDSVIDIPPESNSSPFGTTLHTGNLWAYASDGS